MQGAFETEIKLVATPAMLLALRGHADLSGPEDVTWLVTTYFDTADGKLGSAGTTLRVREGPGGREQSLKLAAARGSSVRRNEWTVPLCGDRPDPSLFPAPARTVLKRLLGGAVPGAMAVSRVERSVRQIGFRRSAIEVAFDIGTIEASGRKEDVCELELELVRGSLGDVLGLAAKLPLGPDLAWSVTSKAARCHALACDLPASPVRARAPVFARQANTARGFQTIAWECLGQLFGNYRLMIASADPEALHLSRVAIRRLRAACSLFDDLIDDDTGPVLRAELKAVALTLGELRDLDVLIARVGASAKSAGPDVTALKTQLEAKRAALALPVQELLSGAPFQTLLFGLASWIEAGKWRRLHQGPAASQPVQDFAARTLKKRTRKLLRTKKRLSGMSVAERHRLRIQIKKLRYAAEFFSGLFNGLDVRQSKRQFAKALGRLQDSLGEMNDLAVAAANRKALFTDVEPIAAAGLEVQLAELMKPRGKQTKKLLKAAEQALSRLADLPPWWKAS